MADDTEQRTIIATVTVALSGAPLAGLRIVADGAVTDCPADWTKEYAATTGTLGDRVVATVRNPSRPLVTGNAQIGVAA